MDKTLILKEFSCFDKWFVLHEELRVSVKYTEYGCIYDLPEYGVIGFGETPEEAKADFVEDFYAMWFGIAEEDDEKLMDDAQRLKRKVRKLVKEVKPFERVVNNG